MIDVPRIRQLCAAGTEAHGDEFYAPILEALGEGADDLGLQVNLIDVFAAWGEREGRDTALLIDLCLGAAIEQMAEQHKLTLPLQIRINAVDLERLANSGRIIRLEAEPNTWTVQLVDADPDAKVLTS